MNSENVSFLSLGDPLVHTWKEKFILGNVQKIVKGNVAVKDVPLLLNNLTEMNNLIITMQKLRTKENNGSLYWCCDVGDQSEVLGNSCMPIKATVDVNPPTGMSKFHFGLQMINDVEVPLIISDSDESNVVNETNKSKGYKEMLHL